MNRFADLHDGRQARMTVRNGRTTPLSIASPADAHKALRERFVIADYSHYAVVRVGGDGAFDFLDRVVAGDLASIRDEQVLYTLMLDDDGLILSDVYVLCDDEQYLLMTEGIGGAPLTERLAALRGDAAVEIEDWSDERSVVLFEGPYSWEICKELFGMDVIGLPFMEHMPVSGGILFRGGKHGEFSYKVVCDHDTARQLLQDAEGRYARYDAAFVGLDFQDVARLENPCWDGTRLQQRSRCPLELQLQWMARLDKEDFIGRDALLQRAAKGPARRLVGFVLPAEVDGVPAAGAEVRVGDTVVGSVVVAGRSVSRRCVVGQALLDAGWAFADIQGFHVAADSGEVALTTSAIPFVQNFSFVVNPSEHSYVDPSRHRSALHQAAQQAATAESA